MTKSASRPTADALLRAGNAAEAIQCVDCGAPWDGTTPFAPPCCPNCRDVANRLALAWVDMALAATSASVSERPAAA